MKKYTFLVGFLGVIGIGLTLWFFALQWGRGVQANRGEEKGVVYINNVYQGYTILGKLCQGVDTDGNGYVSCTFRIGKNETEKEINLQCPTFIASFLGNDCKATQMVLPQ